MSLMIIPVYALTRNLCFERVLARVSEMTPRCEELHYGRNLNPNTDYYQRMSIGSVDKSA